MNVKGIEFKCRSNASNLYLNGAVYKDAQGNEVFIDRNRTEWTPIQDGIGGYIVLISFEDCYIWDSEGEKPLTEEYFNTLSFDHFEIEEDAPEGYFLEWQS